MTRWERLAALVRANPGRILLVSLLLLVPPAAATSHTKLSYNVLRELPSNADSASGYASLAGHFDSGELAPVVVVVQAGESIWNDKGFRAINDLTVALTKVPGVAHVRSLTQPTGGVFTEQELNQAGVGDLLKLPDRLQEGADGVGKIIDGLGQIRGGLDEMHRRFPALRDGLRDGASGVTKMRDGIAQIRDGIARMIAGLTEAAGGLDASGDGNDLADAAATARDHAKGAFNALTNALPTSQADPNVQEALCHAGVTYGALTGRDPRTDGYAQPDPQASGLCGAPATVDEDRVKRYADAGGMEGSLRAIAKGLRQAIAGLKQIDAGLAQIDGGLAKLGPGLQQASSGVGTAVEGIGKIIGGLDLIVPGLRTLRAGLADGAARFKQAGFGSVDSAASLSLTPGLVDSIPGLAGRLSFFVNPDRTVTRMFVTLDHEPYHKASLDAVSEIIRTGRQSLNKTPLQGKAVLVAGAAAFFHDVRDLSQGDLPLIVVAVLLGIFLVLAALLRSIIAPVYLIATVVLSLLATLGLTTLVFQGLFGLPGVSWWLPPFLFVMLVALGADYNIFLMSRIREEAARRTTADATAAGLAATGHVITSAGLILAGTFAALMLAPMRSLQQFGFAVTVGILLDTFVVRSLLVPSIAVLLGRHNWWPSRRAWAK